MLQSSFILFNYDADGHLEYAHIVLVSAMMGVCFVFIYSGPKGPRVTLLTQSGT